MSKLPEGEPLILRGDAKVVSDLLNVYQVIYTTREVVKVFRGLTEAGLLKKRATLGQFIDIFEKGLQEERTQFESEMEPTLRDSLDEVELPFPRHNLSSPGVQTVKESPR